MSIRTRSGFRNPVTQCSAILLTNGRASQRLRCFQTFPAAAEAERRRPGGENVPVWVIIGAVILSFLVILFFAGPVGEFIIQHPALKILALSFLITIGVTIFMEGMHKHVPKAYIYLPMGFALLVELLQMRYERNRRLIGE